LIQLTLQVLNTPTSTESLLPAQFAQSVLPLLPSLLNASLLALLSGAIPLCTTMSVHLVEKPTALHVCAITGDGELVLAESEGDFSFEEWQAVCLTATQQAGETSGMEVDGAANEGREWLLDLNKKSRNGATV
jgi:exosome complex component RRP46